MPPTTWCTRLNRTAALAAVSVALATVAAAPASAGPLDDLLATIDTGSAGSPAPGPTAPPTGEPQPYTFTITTSPEYSILTLIRASCAEVTRTLDGQPIDSQTGIPPSSVTQWTIARDSDSECAGRSVIVDIQYKKLTGNRNVVYLGAGIEQTGVGYAKCVTRGHCSVGPEGLLVGQ